MKRLSITLPVYNEEAILEGEIKKIIEEMGKKIPNFEYEILLVENGSIDRTNEIIERLIKKFPTIVKADHLPTPSYGLAIKECILQSRGDIVAIFNVDFWDVDFIKTSIGLIEDDGVSVVVGSKSMPGAADKRIFLRRFVTLTFNSLLKFFFGFDGTDTHGIKMLNREKILSVVKACQADRIIIDTELILRAQRAGLKIKEVPMVCTEKRKTRFRFFRSVVQTTVDLGALYFSMRKNR